MNSTKIGEQQIVIRKWKRHFVSRWGACAAGFRSRFTVHRSLFPGFTLIELLVVMSIIAVLLTIALPRYFHSTDKAREAVLKQDLSQMRIAIDQYHADRGKYPDRLEDLVAHKYLRQIPPDPITESTTTWIAVSPSDPSLGQIYDIKSGAPGTGMDGKRYSDW